MTALLSPDEYADLLMQRQAAWIAEHPGPSWARPLLSMFIEDGDEGIVDMAAIEAHNASYNEPTPQRPKEPRQYRPASHWRAELTRIDARLDALNGVQRHATDDPAAYGGVGVQQTVRQRRKYGDRIDRTAAEYVRLTGQRNDVAAKLWRAEQREAEWEVTR